MFGRAGAGPRYKPAPWHSTGFAREYRWHACRRLSELFAGCEWSERWTTILPELGEAGPDGGELFGYEHVTALGFLSGSYDDRKRCDPTAARSVLRCRV